MLTLANRRTMVELWSRERGGVVVELQIDMSWVRSPQAAPCCVLEQDTNSLQYWLNPGSVSSVPT